MVAVVCAVTRVEEVKEVVMSLHPYHRGWVAVSMEGGGCGNEDVGGSGLVGQALLPQQH